MKEAVRSLAQREVTDGLSEGVLMTRLASEAGTVPEVAEVFAGGPQASLKAMTRFFAARQATGDVRHDLPAAVLAEAFFRLTSSFVIMRSFLGFEAPTGAGPATDVDQLLELFWNGASK